MKRSRSTCEVDAAVRSNNRKPSNAPLFVICRAEISFPCHMAAFWRQLPVGVIVLLKLMS